MEQYGSIICSITICVGALHIVFSIVSMRIVIQIKTLHEKKLVEARLTKHKLNNYMFKPDIIQANFDTNTIDETMSYIETKT